MLLKQVLIASLERIVLFKYIYCLPTTLMVTVRSACNCMDAAEGKMTAAKACSHCISAGHAHFPCHFIKQGSHYVHHVPCTINVLSRPFLICTPLYVIIFNTFLRLMSTNQYNCGGCTECKIQIHWKCLKKCMVRYGGCIFSMAMFPSGGVTIKCTRSLFKHSAWLCMPRWFTATLIKA